MLHRRCLQTALWFIIGGFFAAAPLPAADVHGIRTEADLKVASAQASPGDVLYLEGDIALAIPLDLADGAILDLAGHTLSAEGGSLFNLEGRTGVVVRNGRLQTGHHGPWNIGVRDGSLRIENCTSNCRAIAWPRGAVEIADSTVTIIFPPGSDAAEHFGAYGDEASFTATNSLFVLGWVAEKMEMGLFHNFGGHRAPRLELAHCTVVGTTDANPEQGGEWRYTGRHTTIVRSDNAVGPDYLTTVSNSVFIAEASSIFRMDGSGTFLSSHNCNAGTLRNPLVFQATTYPVPNFYRWDASSAAPKSAVGDIEEINPFVDAMAGDYRLMATSSAATGSNDRLPMGANLGLVRRDHNAFNLSFRFFDTLNTLVQPARDEAVFYGWRLYREDDDDQSFYAVPGFDDDGQALRLEVGDAINETGGLLHDRYLTHGVHQSFTAIPGWLYTVTARVRRGAQEKFAWAHYGRYANPVLGLTNGVSTQPHALDEGVISKGGEGEWVELRLEDFLAASNRLTLHLLHRTNGSWNFSEWDAITISGRPDPSLASADGAVAE